jgi:hypothetical protein
MRSDLEKISADVLDTYGIQLPPPPEKIGFEKVRTSGYHLKGSGSVPMPNHDTWYADERTIRVARKVSDKKPQPYSTFSATRREQIINDVPSVYNIQSIADIKKDDAVFYNPRSGEVQVVIPGSGYSDTYSFYAMYYAMSGDIVEASGAEFKKLAKRNTHVFAYRNEGLKWGTLADISVWLERKESRIAFTGKPDEYELIERNCAFATLVNGHPANLEFSRVMITYARLNPTPPPTYTAATAR